MSPLPTIARNPSLLDSLGQTASQQNKMLLIQLRWVAVFGQVLTIVLCTLLFDLHLPLVPMLAVVTALLLLNLASMLRPRRGGEVRERDIAGGLLLDVAALTALLYCSGGATNPFIFLYLLQIVLGAILLERRTAWMLVAITGVCFIALTRFHLPLSLQQTDPGHFFNLYIIGLLICFLLNALLLVALMTRISSNLRRRDVGLADLRQQAAEADHIVRMGLLASGAAHELGTPLATLSVAFGDWRRMAPFRDNPELLQELDEMDMELRRCKSIVSGILLSAGEARGEATTLTTVAGFLDELVQEWRDKRPQARLEYKLEDAGDSPFGKHSAIVSDAALKQVIGSVLDNAYEVSPDWMRLSAICRAGELALFIHDRGPGFAPEMLAQLGKPYQSSKGRPGGGLGLFLVVNVLRKLGGQVEAMNAIGGGALVTLRLPIAALSLEDPEAP